jgi:predicted homoserine dehydrogenase-like protein
MRNPHNFILSLSTRGNPMLTLTDQLFARAEKQHVRAGLIGAGMFGMTLLAQARIIPRLDIPVVCDRDLDTARDSCLKAGVPAEVLRICATAGQVADALAAGHVALVEDATLLIGAAIDVVVECTGNPEAGAIHAEDALAAGKHVAMVTKETDVTVGPLLQRRAEQAGLVYTPVEGDQHGALMGLVTWARGLGLDVISAGKARPNDFVIEGSTVTDGTSRVDLGDRASVLWPYTPEHGTGFLSARHAMLHSLPGSAEPDLCEMAIVANATGLAPESRNLNHHIVRMSEIARALCPIEDGGTLQQRGVVTVITCLRGPDEIGMGGGVFLVIDCANPHAWEILRKKGIPSHHDDRYGLIVRPFHLLGAETPLSILCAGLLGMSTGSTDYQPRVDLAALTTREIPAGTVFHAAHGTTSADLQPLIVPAPPPPPEPPPASRVFSVPPSERPRHVPLYLLAGCTAREVIPPHHMITDHDVEPPANARLWALRAEQDRAFWDA